MWKSGKLVNSIRRKISFFRARSYFATIVAIPLLLMNWKGYGFFSRTIKESNGFLF